jgi:hypothetical protein
MMEDAAWQKKGKPKKVVVDGDGVWRGKRRVRLEGAVFMSPKGFVVGDDEWAVLKAKSVELGRALSVMEVKGMFPSQYPGFPEVVVSD